MGAREAQVTGWALDSGRHRKWSLIQPRRAVELTDRHLALWPPRQDRVTHLHVLESGYAPAPSAGHSHWRPCDVHPELLAEPDGEVSLWCRPHLLEPEGVGIQVTQLLADGQRPALGL